MAARRAQQQPQEQETAGAFFENEDFANFAYDAEAFDAPARTGPSDAAIGRALAVVAVVASVAAAAQWEARTVVRGGAPRDAFVEARRRTLGDKVRSATAACALELAPHARRRAGRRGSAGFVEAERARE